MAHRPKRRILYRLTLCLTAATILLPFGLIALWSVARRWPYPELLPHAFSGRGLAELFGGYSRAVPVLLSSIAFSLFVAGICVIVGFLSARAFALYDFRGKVWLRLGSMLPVIIPANVFAMGIHVLFIRWGLSDSAAGVALCHVLYGLPYTVHILTAAMEAMGAGYEEQAAVLGCSPGRAITTVTLPMLLPALLSALSMAYIIAFSQYFLTMLIGGGRVKTFSVIMVPFIAGGDRTIASAYVMLFVLSSLAVFTLFEAAAKTTIRGREGEKP